jgi:hypothetical protein
LFEFYFIQLAYRHNQMATREEHDAAITRIQGFLDDHEIACRIKEERLNPDLLPEGIEELDADTPNPSFLATVPSAHHVLGSPSSHLIRMNELDSTSASADPVFHHFSKRLCLFLSQKFSESDVNPWQKASYLFHIQTDAELTCMPQVRTYKLVGINYSSMDDWSPQRSLVRCNPSFHGEPRYDFVVIRGQSSAGGSELWYARVRCLLTLDSDLSEHPIALVQYATPTSQLPSTNIGMRMVKVSKNAEFVFVASMIRSCHAIPHFASQNNSIVFINDLTDPDIFLRLRTVRSIHHRFKSK